MLKKKKLTVFLLIFVFITSISLTIHAKMDLKDVKNGVIRILVADSRGNMFQGSGFAIGSEGQPVQYFITNYHVIEDMVEIYLFRDDNHQIPLTVTEVYDVDNDYAVVKLDQPSEEDIRPLILETRINGISGDDVIALGFPALSDELDSTFTGYPEDITVTKGVISKVTSGSDNYQFYQTDAVISGGNSGGPLIDQYGHVIGINSFILPDENGNPIGYNGVYVLDNIIKDLKRSGIEFIDAVDVEAAEEAIAIEAAKIIENEEKEKAKEEKERLEEEQEKAEKKRKEEASGNGAIIATAIVSIIVILIVAMIAVIAGNAGNKKKRLANSNPEIIHVPVPQPIIAPIVPKIPQVIGISGYQVGHVFNVEGVMTFGRNPESKIAYPAGYKGVSGNHCILQFDETNQLFILSDMGSSYGTFLESGQKILINTKVALSSGDKFYLVDTKELFEVRYTS